MNKNEATLILALLKEKYPASYKDLSREGANANIYIFESQFYNIPAEIVLIAVNKLISTHRSNFVFTIADIKDKIRSLYWEADELLRNHKNGNGILPEKKLVLVKQIIKVTEPMLTNNVLEPTLNDLLNCYNDYLGMGGGTENTKLLK